MSYNPEQVLKIICDFLRKENTNLYEKLSPLGSQLNNQSQVLIYSLAEEGTHYTKDNWKEFLFYYECLKKKHNW
jgi:hypothetical protein